MFFAKKEYNYLCLIMIIHDFYYNEDSRSLLVEFSFKTDNENTYRKEELFYTDIVLNSRTIISERDMDDIDEEFVRDLLSEFYKYNEPPKEEFL